MKLIIVLLVFLFTYAAAAAIESSALSPDVGLDVGQLIVKYGYPFENHTVTTSDGYILEIHRIPHGKDNAGSEIKGAVLLMPALFCDSSEYVNTGENSLAFILADQGYDVWIGNPRGTTWGRKHTTLNPDTDEAFWDFSFHEMGNIDTAAIIDSILAETEYQNLFYIGHSQGTTLGFILTSTRPEYNAKIRLMAALSPVVYINHMQGIIPPLLQPVGFAAIESYVQLSGTYELLPRSDLTMQFAETFCNDNVPTQALCVAFLYSIFGPSVDQLNPSLIPVIATNIPAGASFKQIKHFSQIYNTGVFKQFDYGLLGNLVKYGRFTPPKYDLRKVTVPVTAYYALNDFLIVPQDALHAIEDLPNVVQRKEISNFNHLDFTWGNDAPTLIYDELLVLMGVY